MATVICNEKGKDPLYKTWHASEENMIIYFQSDGGCLVCAEKVYPIERGSLCLVREGKHHYTMPEPPENYLRSKLFVSSERFVKALSLLETASFLASHSLVVARVAEEERARVEESFLGMEQALRYRDEAGFLSGLFCLLSFLERGYRESVGSARGWMGEAIALIHREIGSELSVEELAERVNVSKFHFCRSFKQKTGMTVMEYILHTRLLLAKQMLRDSELSVGQISARCGFRSLSGFDRAFKEQTGQTPLQYRKQRQSLQIP